MSPPSSGSSRSRTGPAPPSSPSRPGSWTRRLFPPPAAPAGEPFAWLRFLHFPIAVAGALAIDPAAWPLYLLVLLVLTLEWPFHIQLTEGVEIYLPAAWTSTAAAYVLGWAILPVFWLSSTLGFVLIVALDSAGRVPATGITAETVRLMRGEPSPPGAMVDGHLRQFVNVSTHAVRVAALTVVHAVAPGASLLPAVVVGELAVAAWLATVPIPGRMAPRRSWERFAATLGGDILLASAALQLMMVCFLLLSFAYGGAGAFAVASLATLVLHGVLKRLNDTRRESDRRRRELAAMQGELDRREHLAVIGHTASTVFHQIARHHGAIGSFAHLLARGGDGTDPATWSALVREHAGRILKSVEDANRVMDELLRFGQDRTLNVYPQSVRALVDETVAQCGSRAAARQVRLEVASGTDATVVLDKRKVLQVLGNLVDNAIDASAAGGSVQLTTSAEGGAVRVAVRDRGAGVAPAVRDRLFTPFCTTKPDGIGLGLALAKELVEAHGGTLDWHAAEPGTVFEVTLPLEPPAR